MGGWTWCCFRSGPAYKKVESLAFEPAQYVSAGLESEYGVQNFQTLGAVSSLYRKISDWSLPKKQIKQNLFTMNEQEHDFLMDDPAPAPAPAPAPEPKPKPKRTVSSIYDSWLSSPKKRTDRLTTVDEERHESLMDEYRPSSPSPSRSRSRSPSPSPSSLPDFDDVVDERV